MLPKLRAPTHPGEILLEEFLKPSGISQLQFAAHLRWGYSKLNEIIHGKRGITPEAALTLSDALGTSPELWLNLQSAYDIWKAAQKHKRVQKLKLAG